MKVYFGGIAPAYSGPEHIQKLSFYISSCNWYKAIYADICCPGATMEIHTIGGNHIYSAHTAGRLKGRSIWQIITGHRMPCGKVSIICRKREREVFGYEIYKGVAVCICLVGRLYDPSMCSKGRGIGGCGT